MRRVCLVAAAGWLALCLPARSQEPSPPNEPAEPCGAAGAARCVRLCDVCCPPTCVPRDRFWVEADYVYWFLRGNPLPALVTASPAGTPRAAAGVLGRPSTTVFLGDERVNDDGRSGFFVRGGAWLDTCQTCGIESSFFVLGDHGRSDVFVAPDGGTLARPFFNAVTRAPDAELVTFPGVVTGSVAVKTSVDCYGGDVNGRTNLCCNCAGWLDLVGGYRYLRLTEDTEITESLTNLAANRGVPAGTPIGVADRFRTENTFNGGQLGLAGEYQLGSWRVAARALVALGDLHRVVKIDGTTAVTLPGQPTTFRAGGLLAQATNSGRHSSDAFAVLPEVGVNVGYQITDCLRAHVGYTFLYVNRVARPGEQIDPVVDPRQLTGRPVAGATRPQFDLRGSDFWVQGLNVGLELQF